jgi:tripartite-type tricarboxylate transporter receptor subunit TctC
MKKLSCAAALALALTCTLAAAAPADDYPSRPITMIVPFAAGGPTDVVGRLPSNQSRRHQGGVTLERLD